ncbi:hypothetical protein [Flavobacterium sp. I3-2]|uniref:DUF7935 family protein n=1 Tax=Flavobacterium sp. I3-2 TaxID=2748319 RepID=UPI0015A8015B|nr:hypothetical protein [Flavobacterium sp. I3-2]
MDIKESAIILLGLIIIVVIYYFLDKAINKNRKPKHFQQPNFFQEESKPKRQATPQSLQAYERLTILMERIDLPKLLSRVQPISNLKQDYANFLIQNIEQEYDFNLSQQLYVSEESWALITTAKNTVIQEILKTSLKNDVVDADGLRMKLLSKSENNTVVDLAKTRLRKEVSEMI